MISCYHYYSKRQEYSERKHGPCTEQFLLPRSEQKIWKLFAPLKRHLRKQLTRHSASLKSSHKEGPGFWNLLFRSSLVPL